MHASRRWDGSRRRKRQEREETRQDEGERETRTHASRKIPTRDRGLDRVRTPPRRLTRHHHGRIAVGIPLTQENVPPPNEREGRRTQAKDPWNRPSVADEWFQGEEDVGRGPHTPPKVFERQDKGIWDWDSLGSAIGKVAREILEAPPKSTGGPTEQSVRATMADGPEDQAEDQSSGPVTNSISKFAVEAFDAIDSAFGNGFGSKSDHGQTPKKRAWVLEPDRGAKGTPTDTKRLDSGDVAPRNSSASEKLKDTQEKLSILCKDKLSMEKELQKSQELVDLMEGEISALHKKCRQLMLQNEKLKRSQLQHPACCDGEDQVRLQVETLVREKAILARENARLVRENTSMHELLSYSMGGSSEDEHEEESMQVCVPGSVSAVPVKGAGSEDV